jgi:PAS domain S-box-containing protein
MKPEFKLAEQHYRYLFENANDAIWVHDMAGNILAANKACGNLTGYTQEELVGTNVKEFLTKEFLQLAREVRRKLLSGESFQQPYEQRLVRKDGGTRIAEMVTSLVIVDEEMTGVQHIARDVTEERKLQQDTRIYSQLCIRAQERERERIALELHDDVTQRLLLLSQRLDMMTSSPRTKLSKSLKEKLGELRSLTNEAIERLRRCAQDLRPRILDDLGLVAALEWMADDLVKDQGIGAHVEVLGTEQSLPNEVQLLLFRIAQEALNNTRRHAEASDVWITMQFGSDKVTLALRDNGKGFELPEKVEDLARIGKLGLAGMQERTLLMRGELTLDSEPGKGTTVSVEVPI